MAVDTLPSRRLTLTAAEYAVLAGAAPAPLPPGFGPDAPDGLDLAAAAAALAVRGVGTGETAETFRPVPAVLAELAVLSGAQASVRLDVSATGRARRAWLSVAGVLGAALVALPDDAVELSLFPAARLGAELVRLVPSVEDLVGAAGIGAALSGSAAGPALSGRLPRVAFGEYQQVRRLLPPAELAAAAADLGMAPEETELAEEVARRTVATLTCTVLGTVGEETWMGQVSWLATDAGWVGLRPAPDAAGRQVVELRPVPRTALGLWIAPQLSELLEAHR